MTVCSEVSSRFPASGDASGSGLGVVSSGPVVPMYVRSGVVDPLAGCRCSAHRRRSGSPGRRRRQPPPTTGLRAMSGRPRGTWITPVYAPNATQPLPAHSPKRFSYLESGAYRVTRRPERILRIRLARRICQVAILSKLTNCLEPGLRPAAAASSSATCAAARSVDRLVLRWLCPDLANARVKRFCWAADPGRGEHKSGTTSIGASYLELAASCW